MSVMVGSVMESLAPDDAFLLGLNSTVNVTARDDTRVQLASTLSVLVGLFQVQSHQEYGAEGVHPQRYQLQPAQPGKVAVPCHGRGCPHPHTLPGHLSWASPGWPHKMQPNGRGAGAEWQERLKLGRPLAYPPILTIQCKAEARQST